MTAQSTDTPASDKPPLYAKVGVTPGWERIQVWRDGKIAHDADSPGQWHEVDVLGCWALRVATERVPYGGYVPMSDDDGCLRFEKVYGHFELRWRCEEAAEDIYAQMARAIFSV